MFTTEETRANAQAVLDFIHKYPHLHEQKNFFGYSVCGTTMCVAATALNLAYGIRNYREFDKQFAGKSFSEAAAPLLGLEGMSEWEWLFYEMDNEVALQKLKHLVVGDLPSREELDV